MHCLRNSVATFKTGGSQNSFGTQHAMFPFTEMLSHRVELCAVLMLISGASE
jgi:hypothetical protein